MSFTPTDMDMTDSEPIAHDASVRLRLGAKSQGFQAWCPICGDIGAWQEFEGDAEAIVTRHREIGGFEPSGHWVAES